MAKEDKFFSKLDIEADIVKLELLWMSSAPVASS